MSSTASSIASPAPPRAVPFAACFGLALAAVTVMLLVQHWTNTGRTLLDTDDAMRLVQMRDWLAGRGWFDLHQPRVAPPFGFDSQWSRLIDAGLAGLYGLFGLFASQEIAERLMRATWPLLWLWPAFAGMTAIAWRIGGREAALFALLMAAAGIPAYQQFMPGRIDHHNVQIALALLTAAATVWSDRETWCGAAAGALTGLALAVGYESLPYLVCCGAVLAMRFVVDAKADAALRAYAAALFVSTLCAFAVTVGPDRWLHPHCDSIAINAVSAIAFVGAVLLLPFGSHPARRAAKAGLAGIGAIAIFLAWQPACRAGPFAMVDPGLWPIWLADVREMRPLFAVLQVSPLTAAGFATFPAAATGATLWLLGVRKYQTDFGFLAAACVFLFAAAVTVVAIRGYSYAIWFGMPLMAVFAPHVLARLKLRAGPACLAVALAMTPLVLTSGAIGLALALGLHDREDFSRPESRACFQSDNYVALAALPPGLIATDVSFGPFVLALTPHAVMSAPYHWESKGMIAAHRMLSSPPGQARDILRDWKVNYVVTCGPRPPVGLTPREREESLWGALQSGRVPAWLDAVASGGPFQVYRVRP
ncbi:MAG: hypothetical protein M5U33_09045 [Pseudorhodoplanes sp.]|nr:hypothetical protein [Pseudorhodoplanes sp.]